MTVPKKEQNAGVALLLERMKTHPEEFYTDDPYTVGRGPKWGNIIERFKHHLSEEDKDALLAGIDELMQQKFTEKVLEELVDPKSEMKPYQAAASVTLGAGATPVRSSVTLNNTNAVSGTWGTSSIQQATQLQHMLDHRKYLERLAEDAGIKEHKTLFGKLKNYLHAE